MMCVMFTVDVCLFAPENWQVVALVWLKDMYPPFVFP